MRGFVIGTGPYRPLAETAAKCAEWATGVGFTVVDHVPDLGLGADNPYAHKLCLPDAEPYVCIDADLWFLRRWQVPSLGGAGFAACRAIKRPHEDLTPYGGTFDQTRFFNSGLFVASAAHRDVMRQALAWMREHPSPMHEETQLNCAIQAAGVEVRELPERLNVQLLTSVVGMIGVHACRQRSFGAKIRHLEWCLRFADPELLSLLGRAPMRGPRAVRPAPVRGTNLRVGRNDRSA